MKIYQEMEYSNVTLHFERFQIQRLLEELVEAGLPVAWKETKRFFTLSVQTQGATHRLTFNKKGKFYHLRNKDYNIKDLRFANVFQRFIQEVKGHAVLKFFANDQLVVQNIRYGEPVRIIEIQGSNKKVLFERECTVSMEQVMEAIKRTDAEERIPVLKMEVDYTLACLFEAMQNNDQEKISEYKELLENLRLELLLLEV